MSTDGTAGPGDRPSGSRQRDDMLGDPIARALLEAVRDAQQQHDAVPGHVLAAAKASLTWRTVDAELAELVEDSASAPLAGVRGEGPRLLTFTAPATTIVVEVSAQGPVYRLLGQLVGARCASVEVRHPEGSTAVDCDELGRFSVAGVPAGPVSLACTGGDGALSVVTSWVTL